MNEKENIDHEYECFCLSELAAQIKKVLINRGFALRKPNSLISPAFSNTLLPSGFFTDIQNAIFSNDSGMHEGRFFGVQRVYRHVDLQHVPHSNQHMSSFHMLVYWCVDQHSNNTIRQREMAELFQEIVDKLGIDLKQLAATYFHGKGLFQRELEQGAWVLGSLAHLGIDEDRFYGLQGEAGFSNSNRDGESTGPRCELYWAPNERDWIEIATYIAEQYKLDMKNKSLTQAPRSVTAVALGIERLAMVLGKKADIIETDKYYYCLNESLNEHFCSGLIMANKAAFRQLLDGLCSIAGLSSSIKSKIPKKHMPGITQLFRRVGRSLTVLGKSRGQGEFLESIFRSCCSQEVININYVFGKWLGRDVL